MAPPPVYQHPTSPPDQFQKPPLAQTAAASGMGYFPPGAGTGDMMGNSHNPNNQYGGPEPISATAPSTMYAQQQQQQQQQRQSLAPSMMQPQSPVGSSAMSSGPSPMSSSPSVPAQLPAHAQPASYQPSPESATVSPAATTVNNSSSTGGHDMNSPLASQQMGPAELGTTYAMPAKAADGRVVHELQ